MFHILQPENANQMASLWNGGSTKWWQEHASAGTLIHWLVQMSNSMASLEESGGFFTELNILLPCISAVACLNKFPNELEVYVHLKICIVVFMPSLQLSKF